MTKNKTSVRFYGVYLLLLPVVCMLLIGFSDIPDDSYIIDSDRSSGSEISDENVPSITPIEISKVDIASEFGYRIDPITNERKFHTGIDFRLSEGNPVMTTANGIVLESRNDSTRGNYILVKHSEVYVTSYSHLKSSLVHTGDLLEKGQTIGYVGSTGLSTAPHVHYEVLKNGNPVDPKDYFPNVK